MLFAAVLHLPGIVERDPCAARPAMRGAGTQKVVGPLDGHSESHDAAHDLSTVPPSSFIARTLLEIGDIGIRRSAGASLSEMAGKLLQIGKEHGEHSGSTPPASAESPDLTSCRNHIEWEDREKDFSEVR